MLAIATGAPTGIVVTPSGHGYSFSLSSALLLETAVCLCPKAWEKKENQFGSPLHAHIETKLNLFQTPFF